MNGTVYLALKRQAIQISPFQGEVSEVPERLPVTAPRRKKANGLCLDVSTVAM